MLGAILALPAAGAAAGVFPDTAFTTRGLLDPAPLLAAPCCGFAAKVLVKSMVCKGRLFLAGSKALFLSASASPTVLLLALPGSFGFGHAKKVLMLGWLASTFRCEDSESLPAAPERAIAGRSDVVFDSKKSRGIAEAHGSRQGMGVSSARSTGSWGLLTFLLPRRPDGRHA